MKKNKKHYNEDERKQWTEKTKSIIQKSEIMSDLEKSEIREKRYLSKTKRLGTNWYIHNDIALRQLMNGRPEHEKKFKTMKNELYDLIIIKGLLEGPELRVFGYLYKEITGFDRFYKEKPKIETIIKHTELSRSSVNRGLRGLKRKRILFEIIQDVKSYFVLQMNPDVWNVSKEQEEMVNEVFENSYNVQGSVGDFDRIRNLFKEKKIEELEPISGSGSEDDLIRELENM